MSKENEVFTDYNVTRRVAAKITDRFSNMMRNLEDDFEDDIVVCSLLKHYRLCSVPVTEEGDMEDEDLLRAIERVLQDYMSSSDFNEWMLTVKGKAEG